MIVQLQICNKNRYNNVITRSENSRYSFFSGAGLVTVRTALYALRAFSFRSNVSPSTFHGSLDDADARLKENKTDKIIQRN